MARLSYERSRTLMLNRAHDMTNLMRGVQEFHSYIEHDEMEQICDILSRAYEKVELIVDNAADAAEENEQELHDLMMHAGA